jgi:hypothetical protein
VNKKIPEVCRRVSEGPIAMRSEGVFSCVWVERGLSMWGLRPRPPCFFTFVVLFIFIFMVLGGCARPVRLRGAVIWRLVVLVVGADRDAGL